MLRPNNNVEFKVVNRISYRSLTSINCVGRKSGLSTDRRFYRNALCQRDFQVVKRTRSFHNQRVDICSELDRAQLKQFLILLFEIQLQMQAATTNLKPIQYIAGIRPIRRTGCTLLLRLSLNLAKLIISFARFWLYLLHYYSFCLQNSVLIVY